MAVDAALLGVPLAALVVVEVPLVVAVVPSGVTAPRVVSIVVHVDVVPAALALDGVVALPMMMAVGWR